MKMTKWSSHSKYVVLADNSNGKLVGNFTTYLNFLFVKDIINNIAFSDKSTYSSNAKNILSNIDECKWNQKTSLMLLVASQLKLRI
jgi:hypothetical protein